MPDEEEKEPTTWGLVMPFVVVTSVGGPFDDFAFGAGVQFGTLMHTLQVQKPPEHEQYVYTENVPQVDLLAMSEGYGLVTEDCYVEGNELEEHKLVKLVRLSSESVGEDGSDHS